MKFALSLLAATVGTLSAVAQTVNFAAPMVNATITAGQNFTVSLDYKPGSGLDVEQGIMIHISGNTPGFNSTQYYSSLRGPVHFGTPDSDEGVVLYSSDKYHPEQKDGKCCTNDISLRVPNGWFSDGAAVLTLTRMYFTDAAGIPHVSSKHLDVILAGNHNSTK